MDSNKSGHVEERLSLIPFDFRVANSDSLLQVRNCPVGVMPRCFAVQQAKLRRAKLRGFRGFQWPASHKLKDGCRPHSIHTCVFPPPSTNKIGIRGSPRLLRSFSHNWWKGCRLPDEKHDVWGNLKQNCKHYDPGHEVECPRFRSRTPQLLLGPTRTTCLTDNACKARSMRTADQTFLPTICEIRQSRFAKHYCQHNGPNCTLLRWWWRNSAPHDRLFGHNLRQRSGSTNDLQPFFQLKTTQKFDGDDVAVAASRKKWLQPQFPIFHLSKNLLVELWPRFKTVAPQHARFGFSGVGCAKGETDGVVTGGLPTFGRVFGRAQPPHGWPPPSPPPRSHTSTDNGCQGSQNDAGRPKRTMPRPAATIP